MLMYHRLMLCIFLLKYCLILLRIGCILFKVFVYACMQQTESMLESQNNKSIGCARKSKCLEKG